MFDPFEFNEASKPHLLAFQLDFGTEWVVVVCEVKGTQGLGNLLLDLHGLLVDKVQSWKRSLTFWVHGEGYQLMAFAIEKIWQLTRFNTCV